MRQILYIINIFMWTKYSVWIRLELFFLDYNYKLIVYNQFINQLIFSVAQHTIIKSKQIIKNEIT